MELKIFSDFATLLRSALDSYMSMVKTTPISKQTYQRFIFKMRYWILDTWKLIVQNDAKNIPIQWANGWMAEQKFEIHLYNGSFKHKQTITTMHANQITILAHTHTLTAYQLVWLHLFATDSSVDFSVFGSLAAAVDPKMSQKDFSRSDSRHTQTHNVRLRDTRVWKRARHQ